MDWGREKALEVSDERISINHTPELDCLSIIFDGLVEG